MIKPTVGRVVWFALDAIPANFPKNFVALNGRGPYAAEVVHVWSDNCVNVLVKDSEGNRHSFTSVELIHDDRISEGPYCRWMPFQKGQAKKLEPDLDNIFTYHPPKDENQKLAYSNIRSRAKDYAHYLTVQCPESRELSIAIQKIEEAVFWANAAIARHE